MTDSVTNIVGIAIPSTDPTFLIVVGVHVLLGVSCTVAGIIAMLSQKRAGRHPRFGNLFLVSGRCLCDHDGLGCGALGGGLLSLAAPYLGRKARQRWGNWIPLSVRSNPQYRELTFPTILRPALDFPAQKLYCAA
jgi:hypothetical protein